jgi:Raf kinase inhibitor-like YbhB/YbcL family protein
MPRALRYTLVVIALLVAFVLYLQQKNNTTLNDELLYHTKIERTIKVTSPDFVNDGPMPAGCSAKGGNLSPALAWDNLPQGTRSLAIIASDYDAPSPNFRLFTITHWMLYNIRPNVMSVPQGVTASMLNELKISTGKNFSGDHAYTGPRPPFGVHNYYFRVYALDFSSLYLSNDNREELYHAMKGHILGYGELVGTYQ